ncbi:MAG: hypothetical protein KIT31_07725 [Deltaproteobacteria bacterium]|nr:hypothetical protein [Deltaproteobacteria bacterium]
MRLHVLLVLTITLGACTTDYIADGDEEDGDPYDFEVNDPDGKADGVPAVFNANDVIGDDVLTASISLGAANLQRFFERSPYNNRSWLANHKIDGVPVSRVIADIAEAEGVNPLVLVARMQVESSLVSKSVAPSQRLIDRALGCGCPDGGGCASQFKGLAKQLSCGAKTMRKWYDASIAGTGEWRKGKAKRTLDPKTVTPANHATASLYAYTPWVLQGRGGTWLAWNVTRKYVTFAGKEGLTD